MKKILFRFKPFDYLFILISLAAIGFSFHRLRNSAAGLEKLVIDSPEGKFIYPLKEDKKIEVKGEIGVTTIIIEDSHAYFYESPCPNKLCIHSGKIEFNNDWAACIPNNVFIHIEGKPYTDKDEEVLDSIAK